MLVASSSRDNFADIDVTPVAWGVLLSVVLVLLFIDLVRHRDDHVPSTKEVLVESGLWVLCGVGFGVGVGVVYGGDAFGEYISGYLSKRV